MYLKYFYDNHLAQASYMIGCQATGEAAIIDPSRNIEPYLLVAQEEGYMISKALETHIHADFVSGSTELARRTNAVIFYSLEGGEKNGGYNFDKNLPQKEIKNDDVIQVGNISLKVIHTPGHTPEHIAFELTDGATANNPMGIFTGDFVFVGDVGRPDLLEKSVGVQDSAEKGARQMFRSIERFKKYDDYLQIWPGHGAGSACGKALGAVPTSTVGYEKMYNPAFQYQNENEFVEFLLEGQTEPPAYFSKMKAINPTGATPLSEVSLGVTLDLDAESVEKLAQSKENLVVDTTEAHTFSENSIPGTINIPYPDMFAEWMGRFGNYDVDLYVITELENKDEINLILTAMAMDCIKGYISPNNIENVTYSHHYQNGTPEEISAALKNNQVQVLDVRRQEEWDENHIPEAHHISLQKLPNVSVPLSKEKPVAVHCRTGKRSAIASSILINQGFEVINMLGGFNRWKAENLPVKN